MWGIRDSNLWPYTCKMDTKAPVLFLDGVSSHFLLVNFPVLCTLKSFSLKSICGFLIWNCKDCIHLKLYEPQLIGECYSVSWKSTSAAQPVPSICLWSYLTGAPLIRQRRRFYVVVRFREDKARTARIHSWGLHLSNPHLYVPSQSQKNLAYISRYAL